MASSIDRSVTVGVRCGTCDIAMHCNRILQLQHSMATYMAYCRTWHPSARPSATRQARSRPDQALPCKANVHAVSEVLSQKLDIHLYLGKTAASKIGAYDPSALPGKQRVEA